MPTMVRSQASCCLLLAVQAHAVCACRRRSHLRCRFLIASLGVWQGMMVQCRRALKPDGLFLSAMWGGNTLQVAHALVVADLPALSVFLNH